MSEHEIDIFDADPERVVSVTVGELRGLCEEMYGDGVEDCGGSDVRISDTLAELITIHDRTCRFVYRDESYSTPDGFEQDGTYYCSACACDLPDWMQEHVDDIQAGNIDNDIDCCPHCGARVVGDDD